MKRYKITIEEIGQEKKIIGSKWERGAAKDGEGHGYTPEVEATRDYTRTIYEQVLDELDIGVVVAAVNKLS